MRRLTLAEARQERLSRFRWRMPTRPFKQVPTKVEKGTHTDKSWQIQYMDQHTRCQDCVQAASPRRRLRQEPRVGGYMLLCTTCWVGQVARATLTENLSVKGLNRYHPSTGSTSSTLSPPVSLVQVPVQPVGTEGIEAGLPSTKGGQLVQPVEAIGSGTYFAHSGITQPIRSRTRKPRSNHGHHGTCALCTRVDVCLFHDYDQQNWLCRGFLCMGCCKRVRRHERGEELGSDGLREYLAMWLARHIEPGMLNDIHKGPRPKVTALL